MVTVYNGWVLSENTPTTIPAPTEPAAPSPFWDTFAFGTICGLVSAVAYLAANICLRSVTNNNFVWVSAMKALPAVLLTAPWLVFRASRGERVSPPTWRALFALLIAGLIGQLVGNNSFQWSLQVIGLALTVPLCMATQIIGSAILGRIFLGQGITARTAWAIGILIAATAILSLGAKNAFQKITDTQATSGSTLILVLGVCAAMGAGFAYAALGVIIRRGLSSDVSISTTLFTICLEGTILLGAIGYGRLDGWQGVVGISARDYGIMILGGVFNAVAFLSLIKALHLVPVAYANALGATQTALAAVAGVAIFAEPLSPTMLIGVVLTVVGLVWMRGKKG